VGGGQGHAPQATLSPGPSPRSKWQSEKPLAKAAKVAPKLDRISSCKQDKMSLFCLSNGFHLQKTNGRYTLETACEKAISSCVT